MRPKKSSAISNSLVCCRSLDSPTLGVVQRSNPQALLTGGRRFLLSREASVEAPPSAQPRRLYASDLEGSSQAKLEDIDQSGLSDSEADGASATPLDSVASEGSDDKSSETLTANGRLKRFRSVSKAEGGGRLLNYQGRQSELTSHDAGFFDHPNGETRRDQGGPLLKRRKREPAQVEETYAKHRKTSGSSARGVSRTAGDGPPLRPPKWKRGGRNSGTNAP